MAHFFEDMTQAQREGLLFNIDIAGVSAGQYYIFAHDTNEHSIDHLKLGPITVGGTAKETHTIPVVAGSRSAGAPYNLSLVNLQGVVSSQVSSTPIALVNADNVLPSVKALEAETTWTDEKAVLQQVEIENSTKACIDTAKLVVTVGLPQNQYIESKALKVNTTSKWLTTGVYLCVCVCV